MGQYYRIVNVTKREVIVPSTFNDGLKIMEFGTSGDGTMFAMAMLMNDGYGDGCGEEIESELIGSWAGDKVIVAGDYGTPYKYIPKKDEGRLLLHCLVDQLNRKDANDMSPETIIDYAEKNCTLYEWSKFFCKDISKEALAMIVQDHFVQQAKMITYNVTSNSDRTKTYRVVESPSGSWACGCPDFATRGHIRPCKHIKRLQALSVIERERYLA